MNKLFFEYKKVSKKEWGQKIISDLKLVTDTSILNSKIEDINISPFYHPDDNQKEYNVIFPKSWKIYHQLNPQLN